MDRKQGRPSSFGYFGVLTEMCFLIESQATKESVVLQDVKQMEDQQVYTEEEIELWNGLKELMVLTRKVYHLEWRGNGSRRA